MTMRTLLTALAFLACGALPPLVVAVLFRVRFLGSLWLAIALGVIGASIGGLLDTVILSIAGEALLPRFLLLAGTVDLLPPAIGAIVTTALFTLVSRSNPQQGE